MEIMNFQKPATYAVLNPLGEAKTTESLALAERPGNLRGKVVYCVSQIIMGSEIFMDKMAALLPDYAPGVIVKSVRKPAAYMTDDPELWDEIADEADAVIYGCGA